MSHVGFESRSASTSSMFTGFDTGVELSFCHASLAEVCNRADGGGVCRSTFPGRENTWRKSIFRESLAEQPL